MHNIAIVGCPKRIIGKKAYAANNDPKLLNSNFRCIMVRLLAALAFHGTDFISNFKCLQLRGGKKG